MPEANTTSKVRVFAFAMAIAVESMNELMYSWYY